MNEQYINTLLNISAEVGNVRKLLNSITMQIEVMISDMQFNDNEAEGTNEYYEGGNG